MRKYTILMFLMIFLASHSLAALTIKMGSLFPEGSSWDITLKKMAREWSEVTDGRVKIKIYPGGIAGEENDMVRKMRIGQLDAAVLSGVGLTEIVSDSIVFSIPFLVQNEEELDYVISDLLPLFDDDFRDKGFEVLIWSKSGWINFFSNKEILTPDDLKSTRLAVSPNNPEMTEAFKALDLNVIPLGMNDTLMGLQSGMIDSFYSIPMISAAYQWFALAKNMNPIDMSPVIGGILISERTWKRIPEKYHDDLKASMAAVEQEFFKEYSRLNEEALRIMKDNDLNVLNPSQEVEQIWRDYFKDSYKTLVNNNMISEQIYQEMSQKLEAFRNGR
ncbi:TRAP transporter substrate-binding protein DctP [Oceanispirochaeta sp.]|uniref:TRAP transporter substrate-binding protein n=1 Tax=Oceanispirochaeta sp. TaxID=2035350 RepID=UPI00260F1A7C|nr:TRAP transporter substrate-binding protein DctP [Oceanispirochaeta sp.]MDA3955163.1 TRAP transporter substrate-binding protein DctP [Oceanispirochaeta sp.]